MKSITRMDPSTNEINNYLTSRLPRYLDILRQMVEINSFTSNSAGVNRLGQFTAQVFSTLGFQVEYLASTRHEYGKHLFLSRPTASNRKEKGINFIAMVSHLDTVFPPEEELANRFTWRIEGDRVYGPGTVDIKGGTVMILMVLEALHQFDPQSFESTSWLICLDASEETMSEGFNHACLQRIPSTGSICLIFEGGTPAGEKLPLVVARKGRAQFTVDATGKSAHAGNYHANGANAILQLAEIVPKIAAFTDYSKAITFNVGIIQGGSVVNRVPHHAEAQVEMRAFDTAVFQEGVARMLALDGYSTVQSQDGYPCRISVKLAGQTSPWPRNPGTDQLFQLWFETAASLGMHVIPEERGGLSDGNLLWRHQPILDGLGPTGANAHCSERSSDGNKDQEYAEISSFVPKALLNTFSIMRLLIEE